MNRGAFLVDVFDSVTTVSHNPATSQKDREANRDMFGMLLDSFDRF